MVRPGFNESKNCFPHRQFGRMHWWGVSCRRGWEKTFFSSIQESIKGKVRPPGDSAQRTVSEGPGRKGKNRSTSTKCAGRKHKKLAGYKKETMTPLRGESEFFFWLPGRESSRYQTGEVAFRQGARGGNQPEEKKSRRPSTLADERRTE